MLSGGNLDAGMLQVIVRFGLTRNGRFLRLQTQMPDRPGALKRLTDCSPSIASTSSTSTTTATARSSSASTTCAC